MACTVAPSATAKQGRDDPQPQEQIHSIHHVSDEGLIDDGVRKKRSGQHPFLLVLQNRVLQQGESARVGHTAGGGEQPQGVGSPVPSHIIHGSGGVGFTMNTEGGELPGYPTQAGMSQCRKSEAARLLLVQEIAPILDDPLPH